MMNIMNVEDEDIPVLFEQVMGQMIDRCIAVGTMSKHQVVTVLEDMIQMIERGTLGSALDNI
jgi:hypothetical protein